MAVPEFLQARSLVVRLGAVLGAIVAAALGAIAAGAFFTEASSGKAAAINLAGSLRMQTYLIGEELALTTELTPERVAILHRTIEGFEARLGHPQLTAALPADPRDTVRARYDRVAADWRASLRPAAITALAPATAESGRARFVGLAPAFVDSVHGLVEALEADLEAGIARLRLIQGGALFLIVAVVFATLYFADAQVLRPLADLLGAARRLKDGDFSARVAHSGPDELGQLGEAFNRMVEELAASYRDLESRVEEKTAELTRINRSLDLLYRVTGLLSAREVSAETAREVLAELDRVLGLEDGVVCIRPSDGGTGLKLAAIVRDADGEPRHCRAHGCAACGEGRGDFVRAPIGDGDRRAGVLLLKPAGGRSLEPWQTQLVAAVGRHLGNAWAARRRAEDTHRLRVLEERSVIARELHDSLAQSLSYLKIQVARLARALPPASERGAADGVQPIVAELRTGLANAYRQLRELLTTFRLGMEGAGLAEALVAAADEFSHRAGVRVSVTNEVNEAALTANEEIHVLQVVREALSNVEHHARARDAWVRLSLTSANRVTVSVEDDGVGFDGALGKPHHFGLTIIADRARALGGEVRWMPRPGGGTRVELVFVAGRGPAGLAAAA